MKSDESSLHRATPTLRGFDPRGLTVRSVSYSRCTDTQSPEARIQRQVFDVAGRLFESFDPRLDDGGEVPANVSMVYSVGGAALSTISADAGWRVELAGGAGNLIGSWDGRGAKFTYEYDGLLRTLAVTEFDAEGEFRVVERYKYGDVSSESKTHNLCGRLIRHDHMAGTKSLEEYALGAGCIKEVDRFLSDLENPGWPLEETARDALLEQNKIYTTRWSYDSLGMLLSHVDAAGNARDYRCDVAGQLKEVFVHFAGSVSRVSVSRIQYNAFGQLSKEVLGNGVVTTTEYRATDGRLMRLVSKRENGSPVQDLSYDYDPVGNVLSVENKAGPVRYFKNQCVRQLKVYRYDTLYQLVEAHGQEVYEPSKGGRLCEWRKESIDPGCRVNYKQYFEYDVAGNLRVRVHEGGKNSTLKMFVAADSNRSLPFHEDGSEPDIVAGFDACGNQRLLQPGLALEWDSRNQLHQVTSVLREGRDSDRVYYRYGIDGRRVRKVSVSQAKSVVHRSEVRYLPGLEERTNTVGNECLYVIDIAAGLTAVRGLHWTAGKPQEVPELQLRYCLSDHLKSVTIEMDADACPISHEEFYPFGGTAIWSARDEVEASYKIRRYSGREREACGIYYYGRRYYAPWLHRWLSADPAGTVDGLNLYRFVANNPIGYEDVGGLNKTPAELLAENFKANVEPLVLSRISQDQQAAENRLATEWGLSGQALGEAVSGIIERLKSAPHSVNVRYASVAGFSGDHLQNTFESGVRREFIYYSNREGRNKQLVNYSGAVQGYKEDMHVLDRSGPYVGIRTDLKPGAHPTHGAIQLHDREPSTGGAPYDNDSAYGQSAFFLGTQALSYLTYTPGDSMDLYLSMVGTSDELSSKLAVQGNMYPLISHANGGQLDYYKENIVNDAGGAITTPMFPYVEWQSHNTIFFRGMELFTVHQDEIDALPSSSRGAIKGSVSTFLSMHNINTRMQPYHYVFTYAS